MKKGILSLFLLLIASFGWAQFSLPSGKPVKVACDGVEERVVHTALELFSRDVETVLSASLEVDARQGDIIVGTIGRSTLVAETGVDLSALEGKTQAFLLTVLPDGRLLVAGSDRHGTAYGIMELSRLLGVSPWEWWADVTPDKKTVFSLPSGFQTLQAPSVEYRGIFINDEDWGLMPWSSRNYEPADQQQIGPKTNRRIFELLLRLRANTYWPAMHECTLPFFLTKGNREVAAEFGIFIGSSHCEPMVCNAAGEWKRRGEGDYDYVNNSASVYRFWEDRVKEVAGQENIYTLGMRGVHDGRMQGAKTVDEQKAVLERVLQDQRGLLAKYVNREVASIPQAFIPYKEVLDIYNAGLQVPDEATLIWCDDNYGYIRHFPTPEEQSRKGGNGIYYHISYWGRPHDYLWLGTFSPYLLYQQMKLAFDRGIRKMWILNVGDIKPAEYQIELFLDMAWNIEQVAEQGVTAHLKNWLSREFGTGHVAETLLPVMQEHYRLAYIRKPEFMGNTREEERDPLYKKVKDLPWSEQAIRERLNGYASLSSAVEALAPQLPANRKAAYMQLVKYPVQAADQMNRKLLYAQLARHGKADWQQSDAAFDSIASLTRRYNALQEGKWIGIMDFQPRKLPVFRRVAHETAVTPMVEEKSPAYKWNAVDCASGTPVPCEGLGYEGKAAGIRKNTSLVFIFDDWQTDSVEVEVRLLPNHPLDGKQLRFTLSVDKSAPQTVSYETKGRSEEWKENVLCNQAIRRVKLPVGKRKSHKLVIKALDEGVVLDQIMLY